MEPNFEGIAEETKILIQRGYTLTDCARVFNVHRTTMWRWLHKTDGWKGVYEKYTVPEVCWLISNTLSLEGHAINWGIRFIHDHLRRLGFKISRLTVRDALQVMMPDLLRSRYQGCLIRRDYDVYFPMHVWHIDSHDKLARWGFRIHGGIDGATHFIVYMTVCLNKKSRTIYDAYQGAVQKYGHPVIIRSDYAAEHYLIESNILRARPNTNPFREGPSVHNQRIEAFWRILREKVTGYYQKALHFLSFEEGSLQIDNPFHRSSLVNVFLPVLKVAVADFILTWNAHKVRAVNERGRCRPAHIPQIAFQAVEREAGLILPPSYPPGGGRDIGEEQHDIDDNERSPTDHWNDNDDGGRFEEGMKDIENEELRQLRDLAYFLNHNRVQLITLKFKLHLALTMECQICSESGSTLGNYLQRRLTELNMPNDTQLALTILSETLDIQRRNEAAFPRL